ncbi:bifunctional phosphopantothenoylcysteine decarboxylase/phosphopantothenate--cysteine ligase CoaBC [Ignatzschineria cameli]|uniref:Coenzyme A biosynthesis bifunctional protein CoaBC n=1 Tax=Ignatzschineria cameli TaxID=2182793 RepID=A0A2U2AS99_9GAMM|nr:bifunctional phosphopantothenoylcysteine decarboxylase/phosphopantothenate--cysteine ligase CoaBC [Ignatzschineria cameli]PWD86514.1 bifunctional phosphopantothenoylcysteine decarboxylase/phosphopantothenate--cysteine ligase CoaBC [Ignatzschineria cameli]PWD87133.1 bifunctional phosphopantothenoylcysteine decarboxylase/phosphopantothenate--cysteine ligase CoaBC [Ignatzschineria cameli]PWD92106.1 bifunctional phosphopantothenoylcysteine decarboxylase/phosphopantothenate--cysteine ligase CoaBC 
MNIVLGVSGSIAAYKSPDLVRRLREAGHEVRVVMSRGGMSFVTPLTLQAVSGYPVVYDLLDPAHEAGMGHIELARWADLILIAPASANLISRLAAGSAEDLLSAIVLATEKPVMLAPGMNRLMWANPFVQRNIAALSDANIDILTPGSGAQACGEVGLGRMPEPLEIRDHVTAFFQELENHAGKIDEDRGPLFGKKVVITAGPTVEEIDPVRYISNYSSGKMGYALANVAKNLGAEVQLVSGPVALPSPADVNLIAVKSADEMMQAVKQACNGADLFIAAAAVADYRVADRATEKIKKRDGSDELLLKLTKNPDILATIAKGPARPTLCVGFAAETNDIEENAKSKLQRKNVDMICLNDVSGGKVFGAADNEMLLFKRDGSITPIAKADKRIVAEKIFDAILELFSQSDRDIVNNS